MSEQDEPNHALWLATRSSSWSCLACSGLPTVSHEKTFLETFIGQDSWILPSCFFASWWNSTPSRSINTQKTWLGQYPAILTSRLVNNPIYSVGFSDCFQGWIPIACERALESMFFIQALLSCFLLCYVSKCLLAASTLAPPAQTLYICSQAKLPNFC